MFLYNMVWMKSTVAAPAELEVPSGAIDLWDETLQRWETSLPAVYMSARKAELKNADYTILDDFSDPILVTTSMLRAAGKPEDYPGVKLNELYRFLEETFSGEEKLKDKKNRTL